MAASLSQQDLWSRIKGALGVTQGSPAVSPRSPTADINTMDGCGRTALHRAAYKGNKTRVEQLLQRGADVEARTRKQGQNPLHVAAAKGHAEVLPLLITPATLDATDKRGWSALDLAVKFHQLEAATALVAAGASMGGDTLDCNTLIVALDQMVEANTGALALLCWDTLKRYPGSADLLAEAAHWVDEDGDSPLHDAAYLGCEELVVRLLEAGADRDAVGQKMGVTPLWWAADAGHAQLVPLLATPANTNLAGTHPDTRRAPLLAAAEQGNDAVLAALLAAGAKAEARDADGRSALMWAARSGSTHSVALILKALMESTNQQQKQQKPGKQGQSPLLTLVTEAAVSLAVQPAGAVGCSHLLEGMLGVLGPEVAGEVCVSVQQQIQEEFDRQQQQTGDRPSNKHLYNYVLAARDQGDVPFSHLGEALLMGWVRAQEQLHGGQLSVLTRLQHLVVKQEGRVQPQQHQQQLQQGKEPGEQEGGDEQEAEDTDDDDDDDEDEEEEWEEGLNLCQKLYVKVMYAAVIAAAGQPVHSALAEFAALYLQHLAEGCTRDSTCCTPAWCSRETEDEDDTSAYQELFTEGLKTAAKLLLSRDPDNWEGTIAGGLDPVEIQRARSFFEPQVYAAFLAAWVEARRELQQQTQKLVDAVVEAVTAAQQQQELEEVETTVVAVVTAGQKQGEKEREQSEVETAAAAAATAAQQQQELQEEEEEDGEEEWECEEEEEDLGKAAALRSLVSAVVAVVGALATACQGWYKELAARAWR